MSKFKRLLTLAGLAALAALALAAPAQATDVKATCTVAGFAKVTDKDDPTIGVRLIGGHGNYTFVQVEIVCSGLVKGEPQVVDLDVTSQGAYYNNVCGTGKAWSEPNAAGDHITVTSSTTLVGTDKGTAFWHALIADEKYAVTFVGSEGVFKWHDSAKGLPKAKPSDDVFNQSGSPKDAPDTKDWDEGGWVQLLPPETSKTGTPNVAAEECTKGFDVVGEIVVHEAGV